MTQVQLHVGVLGSQGRMGRHVVSLLSGEYSDRAICHVQLTRGGDSEALLRCHAVVDFSNPEAVLSVAERALTYPRTHWPVFVIGSTGWSEVQRQTLQKLATHTLVLQAPNFCIGVQVLNAALREVSPRLRALGYTPVITEAHHQFKKDAPSGTALRLQRSIAPESPSSIQTHAIRAGEVVGDHTVSFYGPSDVLHFSHSASDRRVFARGALDVALWLVAQKQMGKSSHHIWSMDEYLESLWEGATS